MIGEYHKLMGDERAVVLIDVHGNPFKELSGRTRIFTPEQFQKLMARPHEERGCCCDKFGCHG